MEKRLMIQGTMSSAGKSLVVSGFCRIFKQDGYRVTPFKSQNMASASHICANGGEISVSQGMQAEAAGIEASVMMNPILLKPIPNSRSQVYVLGQPVEKMQAVEYSKYKKKLRVLIKDTYQSLASAYDIVVLEGAGSPAEINLNADDIVNMGMAEIANAPVILVADIDRGGVFAAIYGTIMLLPERDRARIKGIIINKFRGDVSLLQEGLSMIENLTAVPVLGVLPFLDIDFRDVARRTAAFDALAASMRQHIKMEAVYRMLEE